MVVPRNRYQLSKSPGRVSQGHPGASSVLFRRSGGLSRVVGCLLLPCPVIVRWLFWTPTLVMRKAQPELVWAELRGFLGLSSERWQRQANKKLIWACATPLLSHLRASKTSVLEVYVYNLWRLRKWNQGFEVGLRRMVFQGVPRGNFTASWG